MTARGMRFCGNEAMTAARLVLSRLLVGERRPQYSGGRWTGYAPTFSAALLRVDGGDFRPLCEAIHGSGQDVCTCSTDDIRSAARLGWSATKDESRPVVRN